MSKPKLVLISIAALLFPAFLTILTLNYETNDDPFMMFIASGALTGQPDEHLQCINIFIGHVLKFLYGVAPSVNWYTGMLLLLHVTSVPLIVLSAVYRREVVFGEVLLFILVIFLGYESLFLVKLQFTATAFLAGFTAIICLLSRLPQPLRLGLFVLYFTIAFLLRREVFLPLLAFTSLAGAYAYRTRNLKLLPAFATLAFTGSIYILSAWINDHTAGYQRTGYYEYHRATDIICNNPLDTTAQKLAPLKWTQNDVRMMNFSWYWADPDVFTRERVVELSRTIRTTRTLPESAVVFMDFIKEERFGMLVILLSLATLIAGTRRREDKLLALLTFLLALALAAYLALTIRIPKRVSTPLMYYVALLSLFLLITQQARYRLRWLGLALVLLVCSYKFWCVYQLSELNQTKLIKFSESVDLVNSHPEDLFVVVSIGFPVEDMSVFQRTEDLFPHRNLLITGWLVDLPVYAELLKANGLRNPQREFIGRDNIVFVSKGDKFIGIMSEYYRQHYATEAVFTPYEYDIPHMKSFRVSFRPLATEVIHRTRCGAANYPFNYYTFVSH